MVVLRYPFLLRYLLGHFFLDEPTTIGLCSVRAPSNLTALKETLAVLASSSSSSSSSSSTIRGGGGKGTIVLYAAFLQSFDPEGRRPHPWGPPRAWTWLAEALNAPFLYPPRTSPSLTSLLITPSASSSSTSSSSSSSSSKAGEDEEEAAKPGMALDHFLDVCGYRLSQFFPRQLQKVGRLLLNQSQGIVAVLTQQGDAPEGVTRRLTKFGEAAQAGRIGPPLGALETMRKIDVSRLYFG